MYLMNLKAFLQEKGFSATEKNFINDAQAREEWLGFNQKNKIPLELQGHIVTIINDRLVVEGHVPLKFVKEIFEKFPNLNFPLIVLYQDSMIDESLVETVKIMQDGKVSECDAKQNIDNCVELKQNDFENSALFLTIASGLVAGIHPCTIGVLLFFIALLFTLRRSRMNVFWIGLFFIIGVFIAYFFIGLGILKAFVVVDAHFAAKAAGVLVIILGVFNLIKFFFPRVKGFSIMGSAKGRIAEYAKIASVPAALLVGIIVGICSFGCTAGIYFSIIGFASTMPAIGISLLLLYNALFILPLILILIVSSNKKVVEKISSVEKKNINLISLIAGILMIITGIVLLFAAIWH